MEDLDFHDLPPFPNDVPIAPLLRISLSKLVAGDQGEIHRLWEACSQLGFFYLDLRDSQTNQANHLKSPEENELTENVWDDLDRVDSVKGDLQDTDSKTGRTVQLCNTSTHGKQLLQDAQDLFQVGKGVFDLPVEEKIKYDLKDQGSYFGYKGYGQGVIDAKGTKDRNEFYNVKLPRSTKHLFDHNHASYRCLFADKRLSELGFQR
jgi:isopenicillin N synthase-like dioxygenase